MVKCSVDGCQKEAITRGYCPRHYGHIKRHGKVIERTTYDPNEFIFYRDVCIIKLYNKNCEEIAQAIIDKEDYQKVKDYKWCLSKGYVFSRTQKIWLHRLINETPGGYETDHKNRIPLDNRKINLRKCRKHQNRGNQAIVSNNTSGFRGVSWCKQNKKWSSELRHDGKRVFRELFSDKMQAVIARDNMAVKFHGEFAVTNKSLGLY